MKFKKRIVASMAAVMLASSAMSASAEEQLSFKDIIKKDDFYIAPLQNLVKFNIIKGFEDNTFGPYKEVTRAQAASIVARSMNLDLTNVKDPGFKDVSKKNDHYAAIAKLTEIGVLDKSDRFNPGAPLTRKDMAKILVKAYELQSPYYKEFSDVPKNDPNYEYIGIIGALGITVKEGNYNPDGLVKRAHLVAFIGRTIEYRRSDAVQDYWDTWQGWVSLNPTVDQNQNNNNANNNTNNNTNTNDNNNNSTDNTNTNNASNNNDNKNNNSNNNENKTENDKNNSKNTSATTQALIKEMEDMIDDLKDARKAVQKELDKLEDIKDDIGDIEEIEDKIDELEEKIDKYKELKRKETDKKKIEDYEDKIDDLEDDIEDLEDELEDLEDQKNKLLKELRNLDTLLNEANDLLTKAKAEKNGELDATIRSLETAISSGQKDYDKAYANTFDKEYYEELAKDTIKDLKKAKEKAENVLKASSVTVSELQSKYEDLEEELKEAEKVLNTIEKSKVNLKSLEKELESLIKEAEDVYDKLEDLIDSKQDGREDYYKEELKEAIDDLEDAIDDLEDAIKDKKGVSSARSNLDKEIESAKKVLKDYQKSDLDSLSKYEKELETLIDKAEDLYEDSKNK